jgi:Leucine-rich repeat (LRR) protein
VTGEGFAHLAKLVDLERLELRGTSLDDAGLEVISKLPKVNYLDISECKLATPAGMKLIGQLTGLKNLGFWETKLDDEALNALSGLTNLEALDLKATQITDESVATILKFQKLKTLDVGGTQLTDDSFRQLAALPNLKILNVANTSIGFNVIDELAEAHKDLKVVEFEN